MPVQSPSAMPHEQAVSGGALTDYRDFVDVELCPEVVWPDLICLAAAPCDKCATVKAMLRKANRSHLQKLANQALDCVTADEVRALEGFDG